MANFGLDYDVCLKANVAQSDRPFQQSVSAGGCVTTLGCERSYPRDGNESALAMRLAPHFDATKGEDDTALPPQRGARTFSHSLAGMRSL